MKNIFLFILIAFSAFFACESNNSESYIDMDKGNNKIISYNADNILTKGNHSYVPLNLEGIPKNRSEIILNVLEMFEKQHPYLEITDWKIDKRQTAHTTSAYIYGLWIDHKFKKE